VVPERDGLCPHPPRERLAGKPQHEGVEQRHEDLHKGSTSTIHLCSLSRMHGNQGSSCLLLGPESRAAKMPISGTAVSAPKDV